MNDRQEILLYEHLKKYGFDDSFFGQNFRGTRITVVKDNLYGSYESAIEPVEKKLRGHIIPVSSFLQLGDMLNFSSEMKSNVNPPMTIRSALRTFPQQPFNAIFMLIITTVFSAFWDIKELNKMSYIEGWVSEHNNPSFSKFPFNQWLRVDSIATTWLDLYSSEGQLWRLGTVALTDPEHINFRSRNYK